MRAVLAVVGEPDGVDDVVVETDDLAGRRERRERVEEDVLVGVDRDEGGGGSVVTEVSGALSEAVALAGPAATSRSTYMTCTIPCCSSSSSTTSSTPSTPFISAISDPSSTSHTRTLPPSPAV